MGGWIQADRPEYCDASSELVLALATMVLNIQGGRSEEESDTCILFLSDSPSHQSTCLPLETHTFHSTTVGTHTSSEPTLLVDY